MKQPPVTSTQAADLLDVPVARVQRWITQGRVRPRGLVRGRGPSGMVRTFDLDDFRPLAERYHARHGVPTCITSHDQGQ